jgi:hypothetical protein
MSSDAVSQSSDYVYRVQPHHHTQSTTVDLKGRLPFPEPVAVLSLRDCTVYRAVDDDEQPILIISDGVTTLSLECGLRGPSAQVVDAAERLSEGVHDFALSVNAWCDAAAGGTDTSTETRAP